jgi:mannose PTS system EIIA component
MIGILLVAQGDLAQGMLGAASHTLGSCPLAVEIVGVDYSEAPERLTQSISEAISRVDKGDGVLILTDVYGATHTNAANRLISRGHIELITGMNVPMLLKVLNYRSLPLDDLMDKALSGGCGGIVCAGNPGNKRETGA